MKKACILTSVHPVFDARIFHKEARSLVKAGYDVTLIAQHHEMEIVDGIRIVPLPKPKNRIQRMIKLQRLLLISALKEKADIYHFHDPEIIPVGILLKLFGHKVIYDMHELVFSSIDDKRWIRVGFVKKLFKLLYKIFESLSLNLFDQIILAEESYQKHFQQNNKNITKFTLIRNYALSNYLNYLPKAIDNKKRDRIIYVGSLAEVRGIREIIQSMEYVGARAELWLAGSWESDEFREICEGSGNWDKVRYLGFIPVDEVYKHIMCASIGLSVLYPLKNYLESIPTKAFDYMLCSLPIIMSRFPYWEKLFKSCALFTDPHDPKDIADKILFLLNSKDLRDEMGRAGKGLVQEKYSWKIEEKKLLSLYERLLA